MNYFLDKVAVITGAASGIGRALAQKAVAEGMKVVLVDRDKDKLLSCEKELQEKSSDVISHVTDIVSATEVAKLADKTIDTFGAIHFLFNNAGIPGGLGPIWEQSTEDIQDVLQVNLMGTINGLKAFVPIMLKQNEICHIVNTTAGAGFLTGQGLSAYKASKHAITAISEVLFADLKNINANIAVSVLVPHWVDTDIPHNIKTQDEKLIHQQRKHLKEHGMSPALVAEKVFAGMREKKFYIFTHFEEHGPRIKMRMENILSLKDPC